jgi:hypothetical protein
MATLHFICGKAGAGKTTLARELGRTLPAVVFVEDEWIDTLGFEIKSLEDFRIASIKVRKLIASLTSDLLRLGVSVVFDFAGNTQLPDQAARQLPDLSTIIRVRSSLTDGSRLRGALPRTDLRRCSKMCSRNAALRSLRRLSSPRIRRTSTDVRAWTRLLHAQDADHLPSQQ